MAVKYIKRGGGKPVAGGSPDQKELELLKEKVKRLSSENESKDDLLQEIILQIHS